ncbi:MAG TPA: helix-turn-helix domain-containing protein [Jatrophihabitantaceae bacterium]|jgi:AcrR family transcriptional regulator|nr:helix-turn-helix domain-containing protein [Jatrophihabitantaceae bacterium]
MSSSGVPVSNATRRAFNPRQAETVERVAAAALEELRSVGYDGLTVRSVASRATVAPATAYTYFSSKNHLIAEIFWRRLTERPRIEVSMSSPLDRVTAVFEDLATFLAHEPELAAATTSALLGTEPDVKELRVMIGTEINARIADALGPQAGDGVLDLLTLAWSGAMLQAGMGHARFEQMGARLARAARLILGEPQ